MVFFFLQNGYYLGGMLVNDIYELLTFFYEKKYCSFIKEECIKIKKIIKLSSFIYLFIFSSYLCPSFVY